MFTTTMQRLHRRLAALKAADPHYLVHGAQHHRYQLNPCLSEAEIQATEATMGITLPAEYRAFLRVMGNGGAGPHYGIVSLAAVLEESTAWGDDAPLPIDAAFFATPFMPPTTLAETQRWGHSVATCSRSAPGRDMGRRTSHGRHGDQVWVWWTGGWSWLHWARYPAGL